MPKHISETELHSDHFETVNGEYRIKSSALMSGGSQYSVGDVKTSLIKDDHNGWLVLDGSSVTSEQYAEITGAGLTTVWANLGGNSTTRPNLKGRVLGMAKDGGSNMVGGFLFGEEDFTLDERQLPDHDHGVSIDSYTGTSGSDGSHNHGGSTDDGSIASSGKYLMQTDETSWGSQQGSSGSDKYFPAMDSDDSVSHVSSTHNHGISSDGSHTHSIDHEHVVSTTALNQTSTISLLQPTAYLYHFIYIGI